MSQSKQYRNLRSIWYTMMRRCYDPRVESYRYYGERGITVCPRWHSFDNFFEDMYPRPSDQHSIDRINGTLGYSPENCRWATREEQQLNRADSKQLRPLRNNPRELLEIHLQLFLAGRISRISNKVLENAS